MHLTSVCPQVIFFRRRHCVFKTWDATASGTHEADYPLTPQPECSTRSSVNTENHGSALNFVRHLTPPHHHDRNLNARQTSTHKQTNCYSSAVIPLGRCSTLISTREGLFLTALLEPDKFQRHVIAHALACPPCVGHYLVLIMQWTADHPLSPSGSGDGDDCFNRLNIAQMQTFDMYPWMIAHLGRSHAMELAAVNSFGLGEQVSPGLFGDGTNIVAEASENALFHSLPNTTQPAYWTPTSSATVTSPESLATSSPSVTTVGTSFPSATTEVPRDFVSHSTSPPSLPPAVAVNGHTSREVTTPSRYSSRMKVSAMKKRRKNQTKRRKSYRKLKSRCDELESECKRLLNMSEQLAAELENIKEVMLGIGPSSCSTR